MKKQISVKKGIEIALRRPQKSQILLTKTLSAVMKGDEWIDRNMKWNFAYMFVSNQIDDCLEQKVDKRLIEKIKSMPFSAGMRLLKRYPEEGMKVFVILVTTVLCNNKKCIPAKPTLLFDKVFDYLSTNDSNISCQ